MKGPENSRHDAESIPLVGSSKKTVGDSRTRAMGTQGLRSRPLEKVLQRSSTFLLRPSPKKVVAMRSLAGEFDEVLTNHALGVHRIVLRSDAHLTSPHPCLSWCPSHRRAPLQVCQESCLRDKWWPWSFQLRCAPAPRRSTASLSLNLTCSPRVDRDTVRVILSLCSPPGRIRALHPDTRRQRRLLSPRET